MPDELGSCRFRHGLIRDVIYDGLPPSTRLSRHRRIAEQIARDRKRPIDECCDELAYHALSALPDGSVDDAVAYALKAADHGDRSPSLRESCPVVRACARRAACTRLAGQAKALRARARGCRLAQSCR
jgi:hypothetical protein